MVMLIPKISVIIPVYNPGKYFIPCLESVINQTYDNIEIILIDDGSTDGSSEVCDQYAKKDSRIICFHQNNQGVSAARNKGIDLSSGDYYHFFDSDDYLELNAYEFLINKMHETKTKAIGFEYFIDYPSKEIFSRREDTHYGLKNRKESIYEHLLTNNNYLCTKILPSFSIRNLRFREDIYRDEDTLFGWQAIRTIDSMYFTERPFLHYVQSEESACRGVFRPGQLSAVKVIPVVENFLTSEYPEFLNQWRQGHLHLMIMLYSDMYFDDEDYEKEQRDLKNIFDGMYEKTKIFQACSLKDQIKFFLFFVSPRVYIFIHKFFMK